MSYILDALRKAEQERRAQQTPSLDAALPVQSSRTRPTRWLGIALLIFLNVVLLLYIFLPNLTEKKQQLSATDLDPPKTAAIKTSRSRQPADTASMTPPQKTSTIADLIKEQTFTLPPKIKPKPAKQSSDTRQRHSSAPRSTAKPKSPVTRRPSDDVSKAPRQGEKTKEPIDTLRQPTATVNSKRPRTAPKESSEVPWLNELSAAFKRNLPTLKINVYVYDENPDARFVIVNMRKFRPGQQIADNVILEDITPRGMILKFGNRKFRMARP